MAAAEFPSSAARHESTGGSRALPLISTTRMQKLDLLLHLVINLAQPIVVCGPEGIGKTTFLRLLEIRLAPFAAVHYLASAPGMGSERILDELSHCLSLDKPRSAFLGTNLANLLESLGKNYRNLVLLLDDAGALVQGAIHTLWQFASRYPALRLVVAMRTEEVVQKSGLDKSALGDAFILEIPALSESECAVFVCQRRATLPVPTISGGSTKSMVKRLCAESRGVPGKLIEALESPRGSTRPVAKVGWLTGAGLLAGAMAYASILWLSRQVPPPEQPRLGGSVSEAAGTAFLAPQSLEGTGDVESSKLAESLKDARLSSEPPPLMDGEKKAMPPISEPAAPIGMPMLEADATTLLGDQRRIASETQREPSPTSAIDELKGREMQVGISSGRAGPTNAVSENGTPKEQSAERQGEPSKPAESAMQDLRGSDWLLHQNPEAYTLQIVAVSRLSSLLKLKDQFPPGSELASFHSRKRGDDLYPLFFGIYPTLSAAKEAAAALSASLGPPLPRQMKSVHQEIRRMMPRRRPEPGRSADSPAR